MHMFVFRLCYKEWSFVTTKQQMKLSLQTATASVWTKTKLAELTEFERQTWRHVSQLSLPSPPSHGMFTDNVVNKNFKDQNYLV